LCTSMATLIILLLNRFRSISYLPLEGRKI
jgi:hypothetical protein